MLEFLNNLRLFSPNIRLFFMATAVHGFVFFGITSLLLNLYLLRLGYGPEFIGLVNGIGPLMLALFSLPAGLVSRRWGSRRAMIGGFLVSALTLGLLPLADLLPEQWRQFWIAGQYALTWTAGAFIIVNFAPYLMAWSGEKERSVAFAVHAALFPVAGFVGSFLGGYMPTFFAARIGVTLDSPLPYRNALIVAGVIDLLAAVAIWRTNEPPLGSTSAPTLSEKIGRPPYRLIFLFTLVSLLTVMGEWIMRVYFNVYLDRRFLAPTSLIGALSAGALFMGLLALFSPSLAARWGRNRVVLIGPLGVLLASLLTVFVAHWLSVGVGYMIIVGAVSLNNPTFLEFSQSVVEPRWRAVIASTISMSVGLGVALSSFGGGFILASFGFPSLFALGAAAGLLAAGIAWAFFPRPALHVASS